MIKDNSLSVWNGQNDLFTSTSNRFATFLQPPGGEGFMISNLSPSL